MADTPTRPPKKTITPGAWQEARGLVYAHRRRLGVGLGLLLVNRVAGFVLPASPKWVIDRVIGQHHPELLLPLALAAGGATLVQAATGFGLSQILGVAAQRAITDMRRTVQAYVLRLPVSYFDSTKSGILISRIMSDAEGIRNLVGTGLVQLVGGLLTGAVALVVLFVLNWRLTAIAILILACFGAGMALAFTRLRPLFRERGKINAEVTGRLAETLGGIRIVKAYHAERSERLVFTRGANTLFRNIAATMTGISGVGSFATIIIGAIGILMILERPPSRIIRIPIAPMMIVANEPTPEMPVMVAAMLRNSVLAPRVNTSRSLRSAWYALTIRIPPRVSARRPVTSALILPRSRNSGRSLVKASAIPAPKQARMRIAIAVSRQLSTNSTTSATAPVSKPPTS